MQLFHIMDGAYLGFYNERGGTVFISGYRKVKKTVCDWETVVSEHTTPEMWVRVKYWIEGHEGLVPKTEPEHTVTKTRIVPAHYEKKTETTPGHYGTREYWVDESCWWESKTIEVMTAEGLRPVTRMVEVCEPGHWQEYEIWFPDVTRTYTVFVPEYEEEYSEVIPARTWTEMGWIDGRFAYRWKDIGSKVVVEEHDVWVCEEIEVEEPIYSYYGPGDEFDMIGRERGPLYVIAGAPEGDRLLLRIIESGDIIEVEAKYIGLATQVSQNEYVAPEEK